MEIRMKKVWIEVQGVRIKPSPIASCLRPINPTNRSRKPSASTARLARTFCRVRLTTRTLTGRGSSDLVIETQLVLNEGDAQPVVRQHVARVTP